MVQRLKDSKASGSASGQTGRGEEQPQRAKKAKRSQQAMEDTVMEVPEEGTTKQSLERVGGIPKGNWSTYIK